MAEVSPVDLVVKEILTDVAPSEATLSLFHLRFEEYLVSTGARPDDVSPTYQRRFPPPVWAPDGFLVGHFLTWSREQGSHFHLHRTTGAVPDWPTDETIWLQSC